MNNVNERTAFVCPRCDARLHLVDGWREYGDQLVTIYALVCWKCGYQEPDEEDEEEE